MTKTQIVFILTIVFAIWIFTLYYRIYKKQIKGYVLGIGVLLVFLMLLRIARILTQYKYNILWYIYYLPIIFIPTLYYLCTKTILNKKNRIKYIIPISISSILFLFVLTNDLHGEVFSIRGTTYHHEIGYFVICLWIFYQLTVSTILLAIRKIHIKKDWKTIFIFLPIILGIIYTIRICNRNRIFYKN